MRCECQKLGTAFSGVRGVIASPAGQNGERYIERCDTCMLFDSDATASLAYARIKGGGCTSDELGRPIWTPA